MRYSRAGGWSAGREYGVYGYRTPWGAQWGTWRLRWFLTGSLPLRRAARRRAGERKRP